MNKQNEIEQLIYLFSKLPGLGQRSSRRIVLHLLQDKEVRLKMLRDTIERALDKVNNCKICGNIDCFDECYVCRSQTRDSAIIAVVETVAELWAIERSGVFNGRYHVLGSDLSISSTKNPSELKLPQLLQRCVKDNVKELIIATNSTLEGQTTAYLITEYFKSLNIKISRIASGVPIGGELDYLDEGTLSAAIALRQPFE